MDDKPFGFIGRFYDSVSLRLARSSNSSNDEINNPCKPGQRSFVGSLFERKRPKSEAKEGGDNKQEVAVAAPSQQEDKLAQEEKEDKTDREEREIEEKTIVEEEPCCFILEQNPLRACCCELKTATNDNNEEEDDDDDGAPCPPQPVDPRAPTCGCDLCRKSGYHGRCYDRRTYSRAAAPEDNPRFERA